jgi:hypothetical protein
LVLGESGSGKTSLGQAVVDELDGEFNCAIASYSGSLKKVLGDLAEQLDIPTENEEGKKLTADQLKDEIAINANAKMVLVVDNANRWPASLRYWLEGLMNSGCRLVLLAIHNPGRDIFLKLLPIEIEPPSDLEIREVMQQEAKRLGLQLSRSRLSQLQSQVGKNLMLARKVVQQEALGLNSQAGEHSQYLDISPLIAAALCILGVVRFIGLGTGNKSLYIIGGIAIMLGMAMRYLGKISGPRKRLGQ